MLKFEGLKVGDTIKAFDFEPMPGRRSRYVTGPITRITTHNDGPMFYVVNCEVDTNFSPDDNRIGLNVYVPMEMFMDFDERITLVNNEN